MGRTARVALIVIATARWVAAAAAPSAASWPGLWGPAGDGRADAAARLPKGKSLSAREAWRRPIGSGFSAVTVAGGRGYTAFSDGRQDHAIAFEPATGREIWRVPLGETYKGHDGAKDGPASTAAADDARIFIVSRYGRLFALDAASGKVAWEHDLKAEFAAAAPFYGFAASPLVSGRHVIVQAGGERSGLVAFDRVSGTVAWAAAHSKAVGYASPILATVGGVSQVLALANDLVYGVRPADGSLLWSAPTGWTEEALRAPLVLPGDRILISGMNEARLLGLARTEGGLTAREIWKTPLLKNSLSPTLFEDGHLYGFNSSYLVCLDAAAPKVVWRQKVYGGAMIWVDGHVLILGADSGELRIARVSPRGYEESSRAPVFNAGATSVTGPSFAGGRVFLRNVEEMVALDIVG